MARFKGQGEKEAFIQRLLLSFKTELEGEKPPFSEFVKRCNFRIAQENKRRELATKRRVSTLRWGFVLAFVLLLGFFIGRGGDVKSTPKDFIAQQMGRVQASSGSRLHVSNYQQDKMKVIHFVLASGYATFQPEKLPSDVCYIVETPHLFVRVVGTVFRVRVLSNETVVSVDEGKVWCYPKAEGYAIKDVLQTPPKTSVATLEKGDHHQWRETSPSSVSLTPQKLPKGTSQASPLTSPPNQSQATPLPKKISTILFYQEQKDYAVALLCSNKMEISSLKGKWKKEISLSPWASHWFVPVLLSDSVVMVAHNGTILRFTYDGKIVFKMRPLEGKITAPPLITSKGVILSQPGGLTICMWEGTTWNLPAEKNFLLQGRPFYDEARDVLIYANEAGSIAGYSLKKKEILWTHRLLREFVGAPIIGTNGIAYVYGENGNLLIALAIKDGHFVWSSVLGKRLSSMDICNNYLVITLKGTSSQIIRLYSLKEGDMIASFNITGEIINRITGKEQLAFLTDQGEVYTLNPDEKKLLLVGRDPSLSGLSFLSNKVTGLSSHGFILLEK